MRPCVFSLALPRSSSTSYRFVWLMLVAAGSAACSFDSDGISFVPDDQLGAAGTAAGSGGSTAGNAGNAGNGAVGGSGAVAGNAGTGGTGGSAANGGTGGTGGTGANGGTGGSSGTAGSGGSSATGGTGGSAGTAGTGGSTTENPVVHITMDGSDGPLTSGTPKIVNIQIQADDPDGISLIELRRANDPGNAPALAQITNAGAFNMQYLLTSADNTEFVATARDTQGNTGSDSITASISFASAAPAWSQPLSFDFDHGIGDSSGLDRANAVVMTDVGDIVVAGVSYRGTPSPQEAGINPRMALLRLAPDGVVVGSYTIGDNLTATEQEIFGASFISGNNIAIAGMVKDTSNSDGINVVAANVSVGPSAMPLKASVVTPNWSAVFDGGGMQTDIGLAAASTQTTVFIGGYTTTGDMQDMESGFVKAHKAVSGAPQWANPVVFESGSEPKDSINALAVDPITSDVYFAGQGFANSVQVGRVGRINSSGVPDGSLDITDGMNPAASVRLNGISLLPDGDIIVCGSSQSTSLTSVLVARLHNLQQLPVWVRAYPIGTDSTEAVGCATDQFGNIVVLGTTAPATYQVRLLRLTGNGDPIWDRNVASSVDIRGIAMDGHGGVYIVGADHPTEPEGARNFWVSKYFL